MPHIRGRYIDCIHLEESICGAETVELDPDEGCLTYAAIDDIGNVEDEIWEENGIDEVWEDEDEEE